MRGMTQANAGGRTKERDPDPEGERRTEKSARGSATGGRAEAGVEPATRRHTETTWLVTKSTRPLYGRRKQEDARAAKPQSASGEQTRRPKTREEGPSRTPRGTDPAEGHRTPETPHRGSTAEPSPRGHRNEPSPGGPNDDRAPAALGDYAAHGRGSAARSRAARPSVGIRQKS